jgi:hypothetical protein
VENSSDGKVVTIDGKDGSKKDNTAIISFNFIPIWNLFPAKVAIKMKRAVQAYYQKLGKKTCIDLSNYGIAGVDCEEISK